MFRNSVFTYISLNILYTYGYVLSADYSEIQIAKLLKKIIVVWLYNQEFAPSMLFSLWWDMQKITSYIIYSTGHQCCPLKCIHIEDIVCWTLQTHRYTARYVTIAQRVNNGKMNTIKHSCFSFLFKQNAWVVFMKLCILLLEKLNILSFGFNLTML